MFALFVFNDEKPKKVSVAGEKNEEGVDVWGNITLEFSNNKKAALFYSRADIFPNNAYIGCTKGHVIVPEFRSPDHMEIIRGRSCASAVEEELIEVVQLPYEDDQTYNFLGSAGLRYEADHVYESIRNGKLESDNVTHKFSLTIAEILEEIRRQLGVVLPQDKE
uniref:Uncharacterized protein n=1 Tax=Acrobeloides nanus TaxID=290746 RepID=A0A914DQX2_9BILA